MSSGPIVWPAALERELAELRAQAAQERNLSRNLAARLENLAAELAALEAALEAGTPPANLAELLGYWAMIAGQLGRDAWRKEPGR